MAFFLFLMIFSGFTNADPTCSPPCQNGGTCYLPNTCKCTDGFYGEGQQCRNRCPEIPNCVSERCSQPSDTVCLECQSRGPTQKAFEVDSSKTACLSRCSWKGNWCWPGYCTGSPSSPDVCTCAHGFDSPPKCNKITEAPLVLRADVSLENKESTGYANFSYAYNTSSTGPVLTNLVPSRLLASITGHFFGPNIGSGTFRATRFLTDYRNYSNPPWVTEYRVGITGVALNLRLASSSGSSKTIAGATVKCRASGSDVNPSSDRPIQNVNCFSSMPLISSDYENSSRLLVEIVVTNGGFVIIRDYDSDLNTTYYYDGSTSLITAEFDIDREPPVHCSVDDRVVCDPQDTTQEYMLFLGPYTTYTQNITARWKGWKDVGGEILAYSLDIYEVEQGEEKSLSVRHFSLPNTSSLQSFQLPHEGLYSVALTVIDAAGNSRPARRFVLYVQNTTILLDQSNPIQFPSSVSAGSGRRWLTSKNGQVLVDWSGHFYSSFFRVHSLLKPISSLHLQKLVDSKYDQPALTLHVANLTVTVDPLSGIKSFDGVILMEYAVTYDLSSTKPKNGAFTKISDSSSSPVLQQSFVIKTATEDGDHIYVWLRATDVFGNSIFDKALVSISSSPPKIEDLSLTKNGVTHLTFLGTTLLSSLSFFFESHDQYSSLSKASWSLKTSKGKTAGQGLIKVAPKRQGDCHRENCSCNALNVCSYFKFFVFTNPSNFVSTRGRHGESYLLIVNATNDAGLSSEAQINIAIDGSKPKAGEVIDNFNAMRDIDFQRDLRIAASWYGFTDQQSGIHHFEYVVGSQCAKRHSYNSELFSKTTLNSIEPLVVSPGTYYVTVVAFNNALEPSHMVCSDGITVDVTPPEMKSVEVRNVRSKPGLVQERNSSEIWIVDHLRRRVRLWIQPAECAVEVPLQVESVSLFPRTSEINSSNDVKCYGPSSRYLYTSINRYLDAAWDIVDSESGIFDYEIGVARSDNEDPPYFLSWFSTKGHNAFRREIDMLSLGEEFFVLLKAENRAGISAKWAVGPIIVDTTRPHFSGTIRAVQKPNFVNVYWKRNDFSDPEQVGDSLEYAIAAGVSKGTTDALSLTPTTDFVSCTNDTFVCASISSSILEAKAAGHSGLYFLVVATNRAGLSTAASSSMYTHIPHAPVPGFVFDLSPTSLLGQVSNATDVDYQKSLDTIYCRWFGFSESDSLQLGVGSFKGGDDVAGFRVLNSSWGVTKFSGLTLEPFTTYFVTVLAENAAGNVNISSDGVRVLGESVVGRVSDGIGCSSDSGTFLSIDSIVNCANLTDLNDTRATTKCDQSFYFNTSISHTYVLLFEYISGSNFSMRLDNSDIATIFPLQDRYCDVGQFCNFSSEITAINSRSRILFQFYADFENRSDFSDTIRSVKLMQCQEDVKFQYSQKEVGSHWSLEQRYRPYVTSYSCEVLHVTESDVFVLQTEKLYSHSAKISTQLRQGAFYKVAVKPCTPLFCFDPLVSNGFFVMNTPPVSGRISATLRATSLRGVFTLLGSWTPFETILDRGVKVVVDLYKWTVTTPGSNTPLIAMIDVAVNGQNLSVEEDLTVTSNITLQVAKEQTVFFLVKGYNQVGMGSEVTARMTVPPFDVIEALSPSVIDVFPSRLKEVVNPLTGNRARAALTTADDIDYSSSQNELAAAWIWNKAGLVSWVLVRNSPVWKDCRSAVDCGQTNESFAVSSNLHLEANRRYFFCIKFLHIDGADEKDLVVRNHPICSDGTTIDLSPPIPGRVFLGNGFYGSYYQNFDDVLLVQWRGFLDSEEEDASLHESGIKTYCVAIGTRPSAADAVPFQCVGYADHILLTGLSLKSGTTYYATVRAVDHVGLHCEAYSRALTCDMSPPKVGSIAIKGEETGYVSSLFRVNWKGFDDAESGVLFYEWCVGSSPKYADVINCVVTPDTFFEYSSDLQDGQIYFFTIKVSNGAGLEAQKSTRGYGYDGSSPFPGVVLDGSNGNDIDYQTDFRSLSVQWFNFSDADSGISHYFVAIGTGEKSSDIVPFHYVGLSDSFSIDGLSLMLGERYYFTVKACNGANLCSKATSDGIVVDSTPPMPGTVWDGMEDYDVQFQARNDIIGARWFDFNDPQSSIAFYEWSATSDDGMNNIVPWTKTFLEQVGLVSDLTPTLPVGKKIFTAVRAHNNAGLWVSLSSNGFIVDITPPLIKKTPDFELGARSSANGTQFSLSILVASWEFIDDESLITSHVVSISTYRDVTAATSPIVIGSETSVSISKPNVTLEDGFYYYLSVTACNEARRCTNYRSSKGLLVDSTPPLTGVFADPVFWNGSANSTSILSITCKDFADVHSGIKRYVLNVGTDYSGADLVANGIFPHVGDMDASQVFSVEINRFIVSGERLYISLWAVNGGNLRSDQIQVSVLAESFSGESGLLFIEKSMCPIESCDGDCTCGAEHNLCDPKDSSVACTEVDALLVPQDSSLSVFDSLIYANDLSVQASDMSLVGSWKKPSNVSTWPIQRIQVSAGTSTDVGYGVFDSENDRIWYETGEFTSVVFLLKPPLTLARRTVYSLYLRVWYSSSKYAVFRSDGVTVDITPPSVVRVALDITPDVDGDSDFTTNRTHLKFSWSKVFLETQSEIVHYRVGFGTKKGGDDTSKFCIVQPSVSHLEYSGTLQDGLKYYGTVQALNSVGLRSTASTDGIVVDTEIPFAGIVLDGDQGTDRQFQNSTNSLSANWHGFFDRFSSVNYYHVGIGSIPGKDDVKQFHNVGLSLFEKLENLNLVSGQRYYTAVAAWDAAGLKSKTISSDGVTVDTSPPQVVACDKFGQDGLTDFSELHLQSNNSTLLPGQALGKWKIIDGKVTTMKSLNSSAMVVLSGSISHEYDFIANLTFKLVIFGRALGEKRSQQVNVVSPGLHKTLLFDKERTTGNQHVVYFVSPTTVRGQLKIQAVSASDNLVCLHLIRLFACENQFTADDASKVEKSSLFFSSQFFSPVNSFEAHWKMIDSQSGMKEYFWAIGSVKGGQQHVPYMSVGKSGYAANSTLTPPHGSNLFVTIIGVNNAGLFTKLQPSPVKVDYTPPVVSVKIGNVLYNSKKNTHYVVGKTITLNWEDVYDDESGIQFCEWGLGLTPGSTNLLAYQKVIGSVKTASGTFDALNNGEMFYASVRCQNNANLLATNSSIGAFCVTSPPSESNAYVKTDHISAVFDTSEGYQIDNKSIGFSWSGFEDLSGIASYEVNVLGTGVSTGWMNVGMYTRVTVDQIEMHSGTPYSVSVRAINVAGLHSRSVTTTVTIVQDNPQLTKSPISVVWKRDGVVSLSWNSTFSSPSILKYEISIGSREGSADIMQWLDTSLTYLTTIVGDSKVLFVTVTAVNPVGLTTTSKSVHPVPT